MAALGVAAADEGWLDVANIMGGIVKVRLEGSSTQKKGS